jgi:choline dehydrogenase-like flavoprotein
MSGQIISGSEVTADVDVHCDVAIVGSGAGGAVLAAGLVERGLTVIMLEEGGYFTNRNFDLQEGHAYPALYQEGAKRATADLAIAILQGRAVGGTTVVNWTTCFRTPSRILDHWRSTFGIEGWDRATLDPHWDEVEERLNIREWPFELVNANNQVVWDGCTKLGWGPELLRRNVNGCANSGYCGVGCPVNGKQSMLVTYLPDAVANGLIVYADCRAQTLETNDSGRVVAIRAVVLERGREAATERTVVIRPKVAVVSGGAINSPALLLRSGITDGPVGRRTFLHPVVATAGMMPTVTNPFWGAPQSVASHHFTDRGDKVGFFLEAAPMQPMLASLAMPFGGARRHEMMKHLPNLSTVLALCVDGLHPGSEGGTVSLRSDGRIRVDYPISAVLQEAMREGTKAAAQVQLAAGATEVHSLHLDPVVMRSKSDLLRLDAAPYGALEHSIFTAHQMGGCMMGPKPESSVVDLQLRHHRLKNLFIVDGSVLPTALGVNPSETIYGIAHRARAFVGAAV